MYKNFQEQKSGSTMITPMFMLLATAASAMSNQGTLSSSSQDYQKNITVQTENYGMNFKLDPYSINKSSSYYEKSIENNTNTDSAINIVHKAITQINNLNFITVNNDTDKEIDRYFSNLKHKKIKKISRRKR
ncbi:MAG TPA: hypothetical protein ENK67_02990 [Flavobacteriia bacterium]|nr:hypothetical protein [Flavobacteriia bacterium]